MHYKLNKNQFQKDFEQALKDNMFLFAEASIVIDELFFEDKYKIMTNKKNKIFIIAGESSGDLIGGKLIESLVKKSEKNTITFFGIGGELMTKQGLKSSFPMSDLALMGITEIIPHIPKLIKRINQTVDEIIEKKPDIVITIDAPGFCFRVLKKLRKKMGDDCPKLVHYVAPTVWAWKPKRAKKISKFLDCLLVILPFEPPYFEAHGLETHFVGHHILDSGADNGDGIAFRDKYKILKNEKLLCLLPGSRMGEVSKLLPIFNEVSDNIGRQFTTLKIVLPVVSHAKEYIEDEVKNWKFKPIIVNSEEKYNAFAASDVALITSGTVSLEVAMAKLPMVVAYKVNSITAFIVQRLVKVKYGSLINIIPNKEILPEFVQQKCLPSLITKKVLQLISQKTIRDKQVKISQAILKTMRYKSQSANDRAAEILLKKYL